jgi:hypothetical protein
MQSLFLVNNMVIWYAAFSTFISVVNNAESEGHATQRNAIIKF